MCGIVGIAEDAASEVQVRRALDRLAERGPDGIGLVRAGGFWLGVRRLAITDRGADQPIRAAAGDSWIAFNGSVADAAAQRAALAGRGTMLRTGNDAELALELWRQEPAAGLTRLRGMFALAIVDVGRGTLVLARDRFGEKPLFLARRHGRVVAFASTVAALRALLPVPALAGAELAGFLRFGWFRGALRGPACLVTALPPGATLLQRLDSGPAETALERPAAPSAASPADAGALRAALCESVRLKAAAEVGVGLFLSGGLDSSALAVACALERRPVTAWTLRCEGEPTGEVERARELTQRLRMPHEVVEGGPEVLDALPALTASLGLPLGDPSVLLVHRLARAAAPACRVVLAGEGADELLLGYRRYRLLAWLRRLRRLIPDALRRRLARRVDPGRRDRARIGRALAADDAYGALLEVASPAFLADLLGRAASTSPVHTRGTPDPEAAATRDLREYLPLDLLVKLDHGLMTAGIEGRCPYLDPAVVAVAKRLPRPGRGPSRKSWLARAFAGELPVAIVRARKQGFALPLDRWLRSHPLVADVLLDATTRARGLFAPAAVERLVADLRRGRTGLGLPLFVACALELHLRTVDKERHA